MGVTKADAALLYLGGSTSTGSENNGLGRLQVIDVSNPTAMKLVGQLLLPGSVHMAAPLIQGTVAVSIGNNGGFTGQFAADPNTGGNIMVAVYDVSDRRAPSILSIITTDYRVGQGRGATRIGNNLFAYSGVWDVNNNAVLLIVDVNNPLAPVIESIPVPQAFTSLEAVGNVMYATRGTGGFATYAIPGVSNTPLNYCPANTDAILVLDRGAQMPGQVFLEAKSALAAFIDNLHLPTDRVGVASFTNVANLNQSLTGNAAQAKASFDAIIPGGTSYIGAGIAAAQSELTGSHANPGAAPFMVVVSDGVDSGAPFPGATLAAANAAKAMGIRIISVQYGNAGGSLMQSIASSPADFHSVGP
jgi:hypothetical protein